MVTSVSPVVCFCQPINTTSRSGHEDKASSVSLTPCWLKQPGTAMSTLRIRVQPCLSVCTLSLLRNPRVPTLQGARCAVQKICFLQEAPGDSLAEPFPGQCKSRPASCVHPAAWHSCQQADPCKSTDVCKNSTYGHVLLGKRPQHAGHTGTIRAADPDMTALFPWTSFPDSPRACYQDSQAGGPTMQCGREGGFPESLEYME
jgi:hypothetical protein